MRRNYTQTIELRHHQLLGLFFATVILITLYLGFLGKVVTISVARQESLKSVAQLEPKIAELEAKYLNLTSAVDIEFAKSLGFLPATDEVIFASLERENLAFTQDNNEI